MELEVKIFFMSDIVIVDVWKDLSGQLFKRKVDASERGIDLEDCKRERRRRSMALRSRGIGLYVRFWV